NRSSRLLSSLSRSLLSPRRGYRERRRSSMDDGGHLSLRLGEDDLHQLRRSRHHANFLEIVGSRHRGRPKERL
ncbi:hypothetical protein PENTCL1PPCAC_20988, partial [Pristionchus entomophagus]